MNRSVDLDPAILVTVTESWQRCQMRLGAVPILPARLVGVLGRLCRFPGVHSDATAAATVSKVIQGAHLILKGLAWYRPTIGPAVNHSTKLMGESWRLAAVYAGFERIARPLLGVNKLKPELFPQLLACLRVAPYPNPIQPPPSQRGTRQSNAGAFENGLKAFLYGQPVNDWEKSLRLAQALRHIITHGGLSSKKVQQLSLRRPIIQVTADIGHVATAIFARLEAET